MATSKEYIDFVLEQLEGIDAISCKKMFGEYLVYTSGKPAILVCDNAAMVKKLPELAELLKDAPDAYPYEGAKVHTLLDIENHVLTRQVLEIIERVTPMLKRENRRQPGSERSGRLSISGSAAPEATEAGAGGTHADLSQNDGGRKGAHHRVAVYRGVRDL